VNRNDRRNGARRKASPAAQEEAVMQLRKRLYKEWKDTDTARQFAEAAARRRARKSEAALHEDALANANYKMVRQAEGDEWAVYTLTDGHQFRIREHLSA